MRFPNFHIDNQWVLSHRAQKNKVNPFEPYAFLVEQERMPNGKIEDVAVIFLTNRECPFRCLMCDLWKNTTHETVPLNSIPNQVAYALEKLPSVRHVKLYNSGNFFDQKAIPPGDYGRIAEILNDFETVLIENHPKFINQKVIEFQDSLKASLQVAIGLETTHPEVLPLLNKQMSLPDFSQSVKFLIDHGIPTRAFILLRPPFLNEEEGVIWAKNSIDFAFEQGVECCVVIPTRAGNGALDWLKSKDLFHSPTIQSLEDTLTYGISLQKGRVFADLWDLYKFSTCGKCYDHRLNRLNQMNLTQIVLPEIECTCS